MPESPHFDEISRDMVMFSQVEIGERFVFAQRPDEGPYRKISAREYVWAQPRRVGTTTAAVFRLPEMSELEAADILLGKPDA